MISVIHSGHVLNSHVVPVSFAAQFGPYSLTWLSTKIADQSEKRFLG